MCRARVAFPERRGADAHPHSATLGKLDGIAEQVEQDLPHPGGIPDQSVLRARVDLSIEREALGNHLRPERFQRRRDQAA